MRCFEFAFFIFKFNHKIHIVAIVAILWLEMSLKTIVSKRREIRRSTLEFISV